jgi:drug/metabolite transporter (DMT)-like permease
MGLPEAYKKWVLPVGMILSMTLWGLSWSSGKVLSAYGPPIEITFYRFFITAIALIGLIAITKESMFAVEFRRGLWVVLTSAVLLTFYTILFFYILKKGKAGLSGIIVTESNPFIAYLIFIIINQKFPQLRELIGLVIGLIGGVVLMYSEITDTVLKLDYILFLFLASFTWAVLSFFTAQAKKFAHPIVFTFYLYFFAAAFLFIVSDWNKLYEITINADQLFWFNLFFTSFFTTALATTFFFFATAQLGAHKASVYIY